MDDLTTCVLTPRVSTEGYDPLGVGVHRASTIVFEDAATYAARGKRGPDGYSYGLYGSPTTRTLEAKLSALEGAARTFLLPSGQAANAVALLAFLTAGDHLLLADTVYPPVRDMALSDLLRMGVAVEFFDPVSLEDLESKMTPQTRVVWVESPGSTTMEVMDLPRAAAIAHAGGALLGVDNTWATPLNLKPIALGADIVTEGLTKYVSGHSDVLMGSLSLRDTGAAEAVRALMGRMGIGVSSDDAALVLRGSETLGVRLRHSGRVALEFARRLQGRPQLARVLHPALEEDPGHALFSRDFLGTSGVFSVVFQPDVAARLPAALDALELFAIGASWGGTRSLVAPMPVSDYRSATVWREAEPVLRLSVGLEAEDELWADVERFLAALENATRREAAR
ncbi:PLP-dependent aspartate aminotransferase family protein [Pseudoruegeria sp. HB172150]|uniref:trans-sulfuration enzyme family protein n=1 Tax=Pseudoruegeria sp. HB172150 TaxID=2721164 RepID=UPI0015555698|nr:PLP-dependent transferase [Pseudoruegeria sp. HB172150]